MIRHLVSWFLCSDGNFRCGQYIKNTDADDIGLADGKGVFPVEMTYQEYQKLPQTDEVRLVGQDGNKSTDIPNLEIDLQ